MAYIAVEENELRRLREIEKAAKDVRDTFHAVGANRDGLVRWEVSPTAVKGLLLALAGYDRAGDGTRGNS